MKYSACRMMPYLFIACAFLTFGAAHARSSIASSSEVDWLQLGMGLFGGLALFLAGLDVLSEGLKKVAGDTLREVLHKLTVNRFASAITGAFVTGILNSSSVTTVLVVGFVTAGVMTLTQSVGVIMGANIGSTVTAQLLAFNLSSYSLIAIAIGFFMSFTSKNERSKYIGMMIMGLGLVFYGMGLMSEGMKPLRTYEPFLDMLANMEKPLLGILVGALFTGLVQSSAATVGIAIAMASEGLLSLQGGIILALGANIGTCVTALLAALGKPVEAVRASVVHITFNILGVLVWLPFLGVLADIAVAVSPAVAGEVEGKEKLAQEVPRQIANANTLFNVINTLLFIGFTTSFARLAEKLVPDRKEPEDIIIKPEFLDDAALGAPSIALENARREIQRTGNITLEMMDSLLVGIEKRNGDELDEIAKRNDEVDILTTELTMYLGKIRQSSLTEAESMTHQQLVSAMMNIEAVADIVDTDMVAVLRRYIEGDFAATSELTQEMIQDLWTCVRRSIELAIEAVGESNQKAAQEVLLLKDEIKDLSDRLFERHAERLQIGDPKYLQRVRLMMTFIEQLRHMYTLTKRIARTQLPRELSGE
ncbi:MAG: Na/Pi cotransporter family protein [Rhizobiaceae bacterium]